MLSRIPAFDALYILIRLKNRNDCTHMFDILNFQIQLKSEKIRGAVSQMDVRDVAALLADHRGERGKRPGLVRQYGIQTAIHRAE